MVNYYRRITAFFPKRQLLLLMALALFLSCAALLALFVLELNLYFQAKTQRTQALMKLSQVEKQITVNPNYPDLYMTAAIAAQRVGNHEKALFYATQAYKLDPLNTGALELKQTLEN